MILDIATKERPQMNTQRLGKMAAGAVLTLGVTALAVPLSVSPTVQAQDNWNSDEEQLIHIGYEIAPVPLKLEGKNSEQRRLVGLGSFIVNAQADCNGCHTGGAPPNFNYANNGNPYFLNQPLGTKTDPTTYLAGGSPFGPAVPSSASVGGFPSGSIPSSYPPDGYPIDPTTGFPYAGPVIISRNLTPDRNGRPEGHTLSEFKEILRTGKDFDNIHPTCQSDTDPNIALGICVPPPVDGSKLQVMPWPLFHNMTDHQMEAIYEYLSTIPCIDNTFGPPPAGAPNELRNDCGADVPFVGQGFTAAASHRTRKQ
jgi:hypothetical protein